MKIIKNDEPIEIMQNKSINNTTLFFSLFHLLILKLKN